MERRWPKRGAGFVGHDSGMERHDCLISARAGALRVEAHCTGAAKSCRATIFQGSHRGSRLRRRPSLLNFLAPLFARVVTDGMLCMSLTLQAEFVFATLHRHAFCACPGMALSGTGTIHIIEAAHVTFPLESVRFITVTIGS